MRNLIILSALLIAQTSIAQMWLVQQMSDMPMATANNAVTQSSDSAGALFVYSFCGIDTSLTNEGIHLKSFKYDVINDQWALLPDVPDTLGKIAASASEVNGIIYVIGGYHVFDGPPFELSSNKVHRFDTQTDSWLSDGAEIPVAIDDQVQAVWRDSLIYVVTGWSDNTNVPNVQIYDPANDNWLMGTSVPNNNDYKAFGANGVIIGDTIYYYGGASTAFNFPAQSELRKGVIDPSDPTQIIWSENDNTPGTLYRPGCTVWVDRPVWVGGSSVSYNFDALAYSNNAVVQPTGESRHLNPDGSWGVFTPVFNDSLLVMDMRGLGSFGEFVYVCGGIGRDRKVLSTTYQLWAVTPGIDEISAKSEKISVYPNPASEEVRIRPLNGIEYSEYQLIDALGSTLSIGPFSGPELVLDIKDLPSGQYLLKLLSDHHVTECRFWSVK